MFGSRNTFYFCNWININYIIWWGTKKWVGLWHKCATFWGSLCRIFLQNILWLETQSICHEVWMGHWFRGHIWSNDKQVYPHLFFLYICRFCKKFEEWILLHLSACHKGLILWPQIFKFCNFCVNNFCYIDIFQPYFWKFFLKIIMIRSYTNSVAIEKQETC